MPRDANWRRRRISIAVMPLLLLAGCVPDGISFLTPGGPVAAAERAHLISVTLITLIVVAPVLIGTPLLVWRYRHGRHARCRPDWEFSLPLEIAMWGIPAVIVVVLGTQLTRETLALDPYAPLAAPTAPLEVEASGLNWNWVFVYPERGIASLNQLAFPAGRPLEIHLTSDTVTQTSSSARSAGRSTRCRGWKPG